VTRRKLPAAVELGRRGGAAATPAQAAAGRANGRKGGRPTAYCRNCGWLVPAPGVAIAPEYDRQDKRSVYFTTERCSDTACVSDRVCDELGRVVK